MLPKQKPDPIYEPDPEGPQDELSPPPGMPKHSELRWIDDLRFEEVSEDPEPVYVDSDD